MEQMLDRRTLLQRSVALGLMGISAGSRAQFDLAKFQIGFAAGGITDVLCRRLEPILKEDKYASVVILEHRPGASCRIALEAVRNAPPNGLSLLPMPASVMTVLPHAIVGPSYHPTRDFAPVGALGEGVIYLAINAEKVPARTLQAYVEVFQKDPSKALYATGGIGSMPHLIGTLIEQELKVKFEHVPYKGGAAAFTDAVGGQVPAIMGTLQPQVIDAHRARKLVILATSGTQRTSILPDVPTFIEAGIPSARFTEYIGLWTTQGTPPAMLDKLAGALAVMARDTKFLSDWALSPMQLSRAAFAERVASDFEAMRPLVKQIGLRIDR
jgi:tripartite-type tricarboxylate transporter receptor subunit TctC